MLLVCKREGRQGFHVGDTIEVPDGIDHFDTSYFALALQPPVEDEAQKAKVAAELAELGRLEKETEATPPKATKSASVKTTTAEKE